MTPHITTGPGVTFRRCQWCGQDFDGYQDEPYHAECAPKAAAAPQETLWWQKQRPTRPAGGKGAGRTGGEIHRATIPAGCAHTEET